MVDLVFGDPPLGNSPNLVFGDATVAEGTLVLASVTGTFAALSFAALVGTLLEVSATGSFAPWTFAADLSYVSNTQRPTVRQIATSFQRADHGETGLTSSMQQATAQPVSARAAWQEASGLQVGTVVAWKEAHRTPVAHRAVFEQGSPLSARTAANWQEARRTPASRTVVFEDGTQVSARTEMVWQEAQRLRTQVRALMQDGSRLQRPVTESGGYATPLPTYSSVVFQDARRPPAGMRTVVVPPNPLACYTPSANLMFADQWSADDKNLVFFCENHSGGGGGDGPPAQVVVPVRRVYLVINDIRLRRVDGSLDLPCPTLAMQLDVDSWTWGFSATLPANQLSNLEPAAFGQPVELEAVINGQVFKLLAERRTRSREFGKNTITVSGRGISAGLDAPYSAIFNFTNTGARTAQQLMGDALLDNGVPIGWSVEFGLTDWLVPAGVWSHQGSRISAIQRIAAAAGGYVQPHPTDEILRVLPRYPSAPWSWSSVAADYDLPAAVVAVEGIEWVEKSIYDRVFVSGESSGVLGQITRAGTAGGLIAPMVTDSLITHVDAARQRGLSILADTGAQASVTLRLPVLPATGVIVPGKFVQYADGSVTRKGIVRSVDVSANYPALWQSIEVETHA